MKIMLSPTRMDQTLTAEVADEVLILNGAAIDLSAVTETAALEDHDHPWIVGPVRRVAGAVQVTLLLPHGAHPPQETLFPEPMSVDNGPVPLPPYDAPDSGEAEEQALSEYGPSET
ncbi:MAG: hypothetical protein ACK4NH_03955 [Gemmobacter sp.]